ncbi:MAG TPA: hypothetical protein VGG06_32120, partial [Thermoanaerobaculia bacterium]
YRVVIDKPALSTAPACQHRLSGIPCPRHVNVIKRDAACRRDRNAEDNAMKVRTTLQAGLGPIIPDNA